MFVTKQRHNEELAGLQARLAESEDLAAQLEARAERAEHQAHRFAEQARYALESAAVAIQGDDGAPARALKTIAHALPYVYSGRRHWDLPLELSADEAANARAEAGRVTQHYGFVLPADPFEAASSLLDLASMLLCPSHAMPVERLRSRFPYPREEH